jgi:hypothetical protein
MSSELLVVVIPSFVALLVAVLGIFQDSLRLRLIGPRLKVQFEMTEPFGGTARIRATPGVSSAGSFAFRVGVANLGKSAAWRVTALLTRLEEIQRGSSPLRSGGMVRPCGACLVPWHRQPTSGP